MIYNQSLFKWDKGAEDETDYRNFHYIGNAFLSHEFTEDGTMLTYTLKKSVLGEASTQQMCFYFVVQDRENNYVAILPSDGIDSTTSPVTVPDMVSYSQRRWNLNTPHGYYRSEEIPFWNTVQGAYVCCIAQSKEPVTSVKLFVRVKQAGHEDFDDYEEAEGLHYATDKQITHIQYAVALNTTDGYETPCVSDVRIVAGPELEPDPYLERTADIYIGTVLTEKIEYVHGERNILSLYEQDLDNWSQSGYTNLLPDTDTWTMSSGLTPTTWGNYEFEATFQGAWEGFSCFFSAALVTALQGKTIEVGVDYLTGDSARLELIVDGSVVNYLLATASADSFRVAIPAAASSVTLRIIIFNSTDLHCKFEGVHLYDPSEEVTRPDEGQVIYLALRKVRQANLPAVGTSGTLYITEQGNLYLADDNGALIALAGSTAL